MTKRVVHYEPDHVVFFGCGMSAIVKTVDHTDTANVSNEKFVRTTTVLSFDADTGEFETENSHYVPLKSTNE